MRPLPLVLAALLPSLASAQAVTLDITFAQGRTTETLGPDDCAIKIPVTWTLSTFVIACSDLKIWIESGSCGSTPSEPIVHTEIVTLQDKSGTFDLLANELPISAGADAGTGCGTLDIEQTFNVCGAVTVSLTGLCAAGDPIATDSAPPTIEYDSLPPDPPIITVEGVDSALVVSVSVDDDTSAVILVVTDPSGAEKARIERAVPTGTIRIEGLANGTPYTVTAQARDDAGNLSELSNSVDGTPVPTCGFWCSYLGAGGSERGGCSSTGGTMIAVMSMLAGLCLVMRRRGRWR
jgi:hypothetical protein